MASRKVCLKVYKHFSNKLLLLTYTAYKAWTLLLLQIPTTSFCQFVGCFKAGISMLQNIRFEVVYFPMKKKKQNL